MKFGPVDLDGALGAILAHSHALPGGKLSKGRVLTADDIDRLAKSGVTQVTVARPDPDDVLENEAATRLAACLIAEGLEATTAFTGRVNLVAKTAGILRIDKDLIDRINAVDEAITLATLPDHARLDPGKLVATIKIIPYAVSAAALDRACGEASKPALSFAPFQMTRARLILTQTPGMKPTLLTKAQMAVQLRLSSLGIDMGEPVVVDHQTDAIAAALRHNGRDMTLILGASATSDRGDVVPAGIRAAGGSIARFGMPVDPGNLLVLAEDMHGAPVLGLPGCVRSPALNGADWVLERLAAGIKVTGGDIAAMGAGGLLKEVPARPQPRKGRAKAAPLAEVILLAAGASSRMGGQDKLLRHVDGTPLLRHAAMIALNSKAGRVHAVLSPGADGRETALAGLNVDIVSAPDWQEGMAASLRAGLRAISPDCPAVIVALADMPDVTARHINALLSAFDVAEGREICRARSASGVPGHPVLFSRRFFEPLSELTGDAGARAVIAAHGDFVADVPTPGDGAVVDLDTPQAWERWEAARRGD